MQINNISGGKFQSFSVNRQCLKDNLKSSAAYENNNSQGEAISNKHKSIIAIASFIGATLPCVIINLAKGKRKDCAIAIKNNALANKDKIKKIAGIFEIDGYFGMLASTAGAIAAGTAVGDIFDKKNKTAKHKEGVFEFLNNMIPTTFVAIGENCIHHFETKGSEPKSQKYNAIRAIMTVGSVIFGMAFANKLSSIVNEKHFDGKKEDRREFKIKDTFVHLDDLIGLFVISKNPCLKAISKKVQLDKILPALYAISAYEAGVKQEDEKNNFSTNSKTKK